MQNKGFVRVFAILLTLVCVFYLSFSFSIGLTQKVTIVPCYHVKFLSVGFRVVHDLCGGCRNAIARSFF